MIPRKVFAIALIGGVLLATGCGSGTNEAKKYRIAVIPKGTSHDFWKSIHAGAIQAARELGNVTIEWEGPPKEDQRSEQQQIVERFASESVPAIILAPCDRQTLVAPVERALEHGSFVVIIDSGLQHSDAVESNPRYLGYVATDNYQGGVAAAERILELLKGVDRPKVMMIRYQVGSESTEQREAGFRDTIRKAPNVDFSEAADEAGVTVDSAQRVAERLLSDRKDLNGIFVPNETSTTGVVRAMDVLHMSGQIKVVGFDGSEILIHALREGNLEGLVLQDPFDMGYQAVRRAVDALEGKLPTEKIKNTNLKVATKENMNDPSIRPLYARDLKPLLGE
jgi:ribose transport system substrate-binding protein